MCRICIFVHVCLLGQSSSFPPSHILLIGSIQFDLWGLKPSSRRSRRMLWKNSAVRFSALAPWKTMCTMGQSFLHLPVSECSWKEAEFLLLQMRRRCLRIWNRTRRMMMMIRPVRFIYYIGECQSHTISLILWSWYCERHEHHFTVTDCAGQWPAKRLLWKHAWRGCCAPPSDVVLSLKAYTCKVGDVIYLPPGSLLVEKSVNENSVCLLHDCTDLRHVGFSWPFIRLSQRLRSVSDIRYSIILIILCTTMIVVALTTRNTTQSNTLGSNHQLGDIRVPRRMPLPVMPKSCHESFRLVAADNLQKPYVAAMVMVSQAFEEHQTLVPHLLSVAVFQKS